MISNLPTAFFVEYPRDLKDLKRLHFVSAEKPYKIEREFILSKIDYENFITDFYADRWFIEEFADLCTVDNNGVWHCIFVRQYGKTEGVLVMSDGYVYSKWAAYKSS